LYETGCEMKVSLGERRGAYRVSVGELKEKDHFEDL
jgi:hypothetical protein